MTEQSGQIVAGKYRLLRRLARGGMGAVWRALHVELEREVAVKFQRGDAQLGERAEERFRREARAAAQLKSPHVVHIYDYGVHEGSGYIAMELLDGEDLGERLGRERVLREDQAVEIVLQAIRGLRSAHERNLVHRDIKPSNLFLAKHQQEVLVKVLDFGIAKDQSEASSETTAGGVVFGSPAYMSPEQARGATVDQRTDVWSLGAVFYRMITGSLPFEGSNQNDLVVRLCTEDISPPSEQHPELRHDWDGFIRLAMARRPDERFSDLDEFQSALLGVLGREAGAFERASRPVLVDASGVGKKGRESETAPLAVASRNPNSSRDDEATAGGATRHSEPRTEATVTSSVAARDRPRKSPWVRAALLGAVGIGLGLLVASRAPSDEERSDSSQPSSRLHVSDADRITADEALGVTDFDAPSPPAPLVRSTEAGELVPADVHLGDERTLDVGSKEASTPEGSARNEAQPGGGPRSDEAQSVQGPPVQEESVQKESTLGKGPPRPHFAVTPTKNEPSQVGSPHVKRNVARPPADETKSAEPASSSTDPVFGLPVRSP